MEQLDLLWNLETHHNSLKTYQKELSDLQKSLSINEIENEIIDTSGKLNEFKFKQETVKRKLAEANRRLREYNYKIEEVERNLYDGNTTSPKQLEYLSQEKDKLKEITNETETEILEFMDEVENMDKELSNMDINLQDIKNKNTKIKRKYKLLADELTNKIQIKVDEIKHLEEKIEINLLNKYTTIRNNRGTGIAEVKNSACGGCNMMIPTFMIDKLNNNKEVIYCESCGRILCKQ